MVNSFARRAAGGGYAELRGLKESETVDRDERASRPDEGSGPATRRGYDGRARAQAGGQAEAAVAVEHEHGERDTLNLSKPERLGKSFAVVRRGRPEEPGPRAIPGGCDGCR